MKTIKDILNFCDAAIFYDYKKRDYRRTQSSTEKI